MYIVIILFFIVFFLIFNLTGIFFRESSDSSHLHFSTPLKGGEPFEHVSGNKKAILFVHGYPGSPKMFYMVRELAVNAGYDVFSPRLPGFSSTEDEFISTNFSMWFRYIDEFYRSKRLDYTDFYIVGISMGGALTLKLAEKHSKDPKYRPTAIATVAAPVSIKNIKLIFLRTLSHFISYIPPAKTTNPKKLDQDGDSEWVGYKGDFPKQALSLTIGLKAIKRDLKDITVPAFLCHAKEDKTVPFENLNYISNHISSDDIVIRVMSLKEWNHTNHSIFIYKSVVNTVWNSIDSFLNYHSSN